MIGLKCETAAYVTESDGRVSPRALKARTIWRKHSALNRMERSLLTGMASAHSVGTAQRNDLLVIEAINHQSCIIAQGRRPAPCGRR